MNCHPVAAWPQRWPYSCNEQMQATGAIGLPLRNLKRRREKTKDVEPCVMTKYKGILIQECCTQKLPQAPRQTWGTELETSTGLKKINRQRRRTLLIQGH